MLEWLDECIRKSRAIRLRRGCAVLFEVNNKKRQRCQNFIHFIVIVKRSIINKVSL